LPFRQGAEKASFDNLLVGEEAQALTMKQVLWCAPFATCWAASATGATQGKLTLTECRIESAASAGSIAARCGLYTVRENRDDPQSKELQLRVAVVPALSANAQGEPLFILSGGPGQAASDFYTSVSPVFARVRRERDIVILDQRGTGASNRLDCDFPDDADMALNSAEQLRKNALACLAALPGDPRFYTTSVAVRDLDEVRAALGHERLNLYGVSYGTRVAQHYARRFGPRVRTMILDGVVPPDVPLGPEVALENQRTLDRILERCSAEPGCKAAFPNVRSSFEALRGRLEREPLHLTIPDPLNAEPVDLTFGALHLAAAVRLLTYSDESASVLPLLIHQAEVLRQPQALAAQYLMVKRATDVQFAYGMHFAVICSEDAPRWPESAAADEAAAGTYLGTTFMSSLRSVCGVWPRGTVDDDFGEPLKSDVPTLILSGGNDPATPQAYGEHVRPGFANGRHLVLEGQGHGQLGTSCMPRVIAAFIGRGSVTGLPTDCLKKVSPAPPMLSRSATAP